MQSRSQGERVRVEEIRRWELKRVGGGFGGES